MCVKALALATFHASKANVLSRLPSYSPRPCSQNASSAQSTSPLPSAVSTPTRIVSNNPDTAEYKTAPTMRCELGATRPESQRAEPVGMSNSDVVEGAIQSVPDSAFVGREMTYLIHWRGIPRDSSTWKPLSRLSSCQRFIDRYHCQDPFALGP